MLYISKYFILLLSGQFRLAERIENKRKHMREFFVDFHLTPWCWQEGDDLVFEVVDYDKGAQQGDLMCTCVVPNKATARGDCTKGRSCTTLYGRYTTGTLPVQQYMTTNIH